VLAACVAGAKKSPAFRRDNGEAGRLRRAGAVTREGMHAIYSPLGSPLGRFLPWKQEQSASLSS
jgi:hypothetical protein